VLTGIVAIRLTWTGRRRIQVDVTMSLDEEHTVAGKDRELDGLVQLLGENDFWLKRFSSAARG